MRETAREGNIHTETHITNKILQELTPATSYTEFHNLQNVLNYLKKSGKIPEVTVYHFISCKE